MTTILKVTDGTTPGTVNCIYNNVSNRSFNFPKAAWTPVIPRLRRSTLGGRCPYEDVVEEITLDVFGDTAAETLSNLAKLSRLIDQAVQWSRGDRVSPVTIQYQPNGSSLGSALSALVLGRADRDETSGVSLPISTNEKLKCYVIAGVKIRVWRRGQWLGASENSTSSGSASNNTIQSVTFPTNAETLSPTTLSLLMSNFTTNTSTTLTGALLYAASTSELLVLEAEGMANGTRYTATVNTGIQGRGTGVTVLRYQASALTGETSASISLASLPSTCTLIGVYAMVLGSSSTAFQLRANAALTSFAGPGGPPTVSTNYKQIDASANITPQLLNLGTLASPGGFSSLSVTTAASNTTGVLWIDYIAIVALDVPTSGAIAFQNNTLSMGASNTSGTLAIKDRSLTHLTPSATFTVGTSESPLTVLDDLYILTKGTGLVAALLASGPSSGWRLINSSNSPILTTLSATRRVAYLTPY